MDARKINLSLKSLTREALPSLHKITLKASSFREATSNDIPHILLLENEETKTYFGPNINLQQLLELSIFPLVILDQENSIIAFICFNSFPKVPALNPDCWRNWIEFYYKLSNFTHQNTIFVEYFVFKFLADPMMLKVVFVEIFTHFVQLSHICIVAPPSEYYGIYDELLRVFGKVFFPEISTNLKKCQRIYVFEREVFIKPLKFRIASPEDNDNLVEILDKRYPKMKKNYGEFYVAENILKQDKSKTFIVMEKNDEYLGAMWLNQQINLDYLNANFELALFEGLWETTNENSNDDYYIIKDIEPKESELFYSRVSSFSQAEIVPEDESLESENSSKMKSLEQILLSLSFEIGNSSRSSESVNKYQDFWTSAKQKFSGINPYFQITEKNIPVVFNESNAFAIDLFGTNDEIIDGRRIVELLRAAFSTCIDRHYCIALVKSTLSTEPLLQNFTRVAPRPQSDCDLSLYITHRNTIMAELVLSHITNGDVNDIKSFLITDSSEKLNYTAEIMDIIQDTLTNSQRIYDVICIRSNNNLVGIVILRSETKLHILRKHFELEDFTNYKISDEPNLHGRILYFLLHPLFDSQSGYIFREITRLTNYHYFYYSIEETKFLNIFNNLLPEMYPVLPSVNYDIHKKEDFNDRIHIPDGVFDDVHPFPLYFQSLQFSQSPRINIDMKITTIGFDNVCKGFLKELLFSKKYREYKFTNITVITEPGIYESEKSSFYSKIYKLLNWSQYFNPSYHKKLELRTWVNFVGGSLGAIDRKLKTVILKDGSKLKYDYLFLVCSMEFGFPADVKKQTKTPLNYILINNAMNAVLVYHKINMIKKLLPNGFDIVVYGNALRTYACLNFLLEQGIPGKYIHFVKTDITGKDEFNIGAFRDKWLEDKIMKILEKENVNIYPGYRFFRWEIYNDVNIIKSITFQSKFSVITLNCTIFMCFNRKTMHRVPRYVFQRAGLIIDGRLVIDENYKMNDPYIYAAGPMIQYKRLLFASQYDHMYYNQFEVGESLADKFSVNFLPKPQKKYCSKILTFERPMCSQIFLPGGYLYILVTQPGFILLPHIAELFTNYGKDMMTRENVEKNQDENKSGDNSCYRSEFFRVRLYDNGVIKTFSCITKQVNRPLDFLAKLFTYNEKMLNNLRKHFEYGKIDDFLEFLSGTWTSALLHPGFNKVQEMNNNIMMKTIQSDHFTRKLVKETIKVSKKFALSEDEKKSLRNTLDKEDVIKSLENNLIEFINENPYYLFMYKNCDVKSKL